MRDEAICILEKHFRGRGRNGFCHEHSLRRVASAFPPHPPKNQRLLLPTRERALFFDEWRGGMGLPWGGWMS